jgi:hypothetical protein
MMYSFLALSIQFQPVRLSRYNQQSVRLRSLTHCAALWITSIHEMSSDLPPLGRHGDVSGLAAGELDVRRRGSQ